MRLAKHVKCDNVEKKSCITFDEPIYPTCDESVNLSKNKSGFYIRSVLVARATQLETFCFPVKKCAG